METAMYKPTHLGLASENIRKLREDRIARKANEAGRSEGECSKIFEKIGDRPLKEMAGIACCLSEDEKKLLVIFMFAQLKAAADKTLEPAKVEARVKNYIAILTEDDLNDDIVFELFKGCQEYYKSEALKPLYPLLRSNRSFCESIKRLCGQDAETLMDAFEDGTVSEYFNKAAAAKTGVDGSYAEALELVGVIKDTVLYKECMVFYVVICGSEEYRQIGENGLYEIAVNFSTEMRKKLLFNMVKSMDTVQLRKFAKVVGLFTGLTGEKDSPQYVEFLDGLTPQYQTRYATWMNQYLITAALGKTEVADFWYNYAGKIAVKEHGEGVLILEFQQFVVFELAKECTAYFYDKEYYKQNIVDNITDITTEPELINFFNAKTELGGTYEKNWRRAHIGDWQFPVRDYLSKHMKMN